MSYTSLVEFPCNPGKGKELLALFSEALVDTRAYKGCQSIEVYTDGDNPDSVLLWEKWDSKADHEAYVAWRTETGMMDMLAGFMDPEKLRMAPLVSHDV